MDGIVQLVRTNDKIVIIDKFRCINPIELKLDEPGKKWMKGQNIVTWVVDSRNYVGSQYYYNTYETWEWFMGNYFTHDLSIRDIVSNVLFSSVS